MEVFPSILCKRKDCDDAILMIFMNYVLSDSVEHFNLIILRLTLAIHLFDI